MTVSRSSASRLVRTSVRRSSTIRSASSAGGPDRVVALLPGAAPLLLGDAQRLGRAQLGGSRAVERLAGLALGRLDRGQGRLERALRLGQARPGVGDDRLREPEPLGDREGLAPAGQPDGQAVGRRQRLEVELDRGVACLRRGVGIGLELGVVGRRRDQGARPDEVVEKGLGQRRALGRVGPGAQLVEQDERAGPGRLDDPGDRAQVAGERRQRLGDRLLVADVGEDVAPDRQPAAGFGRDVEAGLVHQAQQPERAQGHGLAAGVRAGHDQRRVAVADPDVDRDDRAGQARDGGPTAGSPRSARSSRRGWRATRRRATPWPPRSRTGRAPRASRAGRPRWPPRTPTARRGCARSPRPRRPAPRARRCPARPRRAAR